MPSEPPRRKRRLLIALPPGRPCLSLTTEVRLATVSNSGHAPDAPHDSKTPHLSLREAETIERLLTACTYYQQEGKHALSDLVDRIGITMMQAFIARKSRMPDPATEDL